MRCEAVRELFSEIYDGAAEGQALLMKHLQSCETCMEEYRDYSQLLDELQALPVPELPAGFHESAMIRVQAIAPPNDSKIDNLLEEIETRKRIRTAKRNNQPLRKTASATRRWAGVAAAACLLLACIWAVRTLNLPERHNNESDYAASQAAAEYYVDHEIPVEAIMPPIGMDHMQYDSPPESAHAEEQDLPIDDIFGYDYAIQHAADDISLEDLDFSNVYYDDYAPISPIHQAAELDYDMLANDDEDWADEGIGRRIWGLEYDHNDESDEYPAFAAGAATEAVPNMLADGIIDPLLAPPLVHGGEGSRAWIIAVFAGLLPLCIALGFVLRSIHKNKVSREAGKPQ